MMRVILKVNPEDLILETISRLCILLTGMIISHIFSYFKV